MVKIPRNLCGLALAAGLTLSGPAAAFADDKPAAESGTQSVEKFLPPSLQSKPTKDVEGVANLGGAYGQKCAACATKCAPKCVKYEDDVCTVCGQANCRGHHSHDLHLEHNLGEALHGKFNRERLRARFGYFIPEGSCGQGTPPLGAYHMGYAVNPYHFDPRDAGVYAAQGWGAPMSVPLAPNVEHQYNYGWGIPSSRLTGIYRYHREPGIIGPYGAGPAIGPGYYPTSYPNQHPFVGNPAYGDPQPGPIVQGAAIPEARADKKTELR